MEYQNYTTHSSDWITFAIIGLAFVYGMFHYLGAYNIKSILSTFLSSQWSVSSPHYFINMVFNVNTLVVLGLFVYTGVHYMHPGMTLKNTLFLKLIFCFLGLIAAQRVINYLHSGVTKTHPFFANYLSIQKKFAHTAAILALPFLIISLYSGLLKIQLFIAGATVLGGTYLFGTLKSITTSNKIKGPLKYHLIFYLCGNEIIPFFLFYHLLK